MYEISKYGMKIIIDLQYTIHISSYFKIFLLYGQQFNIGMSMVYKVNRTICADAGNKMKRKLFFELSVWIHFRHV
jgi:hypothetical protein